MVISNIGLATSELQFFPATFCGRVGPPSGWCGRRRTGRVSAGGRGRSSMLPPQTRPSPASGRRGPEPAPVGLAARGANAGGIRLGISERCLCPLPRRGATSCFTLLARFGSLRCPSEIVGLKWSDISWEPKRERFTVHAVKTEHDADAGIRVVPLFPELAALFREAFEAAEPGAVYCCPQDPANICGQMYRKVVLQAMARAGVNPWPKLFQNCRASRETELAERYPVQVVCSWTGNSPAVAAKHYLQTTEDHDARATAEVAQNVAQPSPEMPRHAVNGESPEAVLQAATGDCTPMQINMVRSRGVEPPFAVKRTRT